MGLIGYLLEYFRGTDGNAEVSDAKCDPGGGDTVTCRDYQPSGYDGQPLPGDYLLLVPGPEKGSYKVAGYVDPNNAGKARPGDVRLYVRDGQGDVQGELHLTNDGAEPDWAATAGALIARADRTDKRFDDLEAKYNSHTHPQWACSGNDTAPLADAQTTSAVIEADQFSGEPTGADKGWVT